MDGLCGRCGSSAFGSLRHYVIRHSAQILFMDPAVVCVSVSGAVGRRCLSSSVAFCGPASLGRGPACCSPARVGRFRAPLQASVGSGESHAPRLDLRPHHLLAFQERTHTSASIRCASVPTRTALDDVPVELTSPHPHVEWQTRHARITRTSRRSAASALSAGDSVEMSSALESALSSVRRSLFRYRARSRLERNLRYSGE